MLLSSWGFQQNFIINFCVCVLVQVHVKTVQLKHDKVIQNKNSVGYSFHVNTNEIKIFSFM